MQLVQKKEGEITITIPLLKVEDAPLSESGKNRVLYTSHGFVNAEGYRVSLTIIPAK